MTEHVLANRWQETPIQNMIGSALLNLSEHQWRAIAVTALILLLWCVWSIVRPWLVKVISGVTNVGINEQKWPSQLN